jgi:hypothetical protein
MLRPLTRRRLLEAQHSPMKTCGGGFARVPTNFSCDGRARACSAGRSAFRGPNSGALTLFRRGLGKPHTAMIAGALALASFHVPAAKREE